MNPNQAPVAVLGAGTMGIGIAALAVGRGIDVHLVETDGEAARTAAARVHHQVRLGRLLGMLPKDVEDGRVQVWDGVESIPEPHGLAAVVEAITENPEWKLDLFARLGKTIPSGVPLVSNTSAIPIDEMAAALDDPADLVGVHFMNPPYLISTVEVVRGPRSAESALTAVIGLLERLGCRPVVVGDGPGFVINRILQRSINEAAKVVEEGLAGAAEVDALFEGCLGHRTGPLATADLIGLDNVVDTLEVLHERTGDAGYRPCELLRHKVSQGEYGRKSGKGFFEYGANR